MRRASRIDDNQREIVSALRRIGVSVDFLHAVGGGVPDLLIGYRGVTSLLEIKGLASLKKFPQTNGLNAEQEAWHNAWRGSPVMVARSVPEAIRMATGEQGEIRITR